MEDIMVLERKRLPPKTDFSVSTSDRYSDRSVCMCIFFYFNKDSLSNFAVPSLARWLVLWSFSIWMLGLNPGLGVDVDYDSEFTLNCRSWSNQPQ